MRHGRIDAAAGPAWTDVFKSDAAGGADGPPARGMLLSVPADGAGDVEYRWRAASESDWTADEDDPPRLAPGECAPIVGGAAPIFHIQARGVAGLVEVQIEETVK